VLAVTIASTLELWRCKELRGTCRTDPKSGRQEIWVVRRVEDLGWVLKVVACFTLHATADRGQKQQPAATLLPDNACGQSAAGKEAAASNHFM
jgi:hypothetical protein